MNVAVGDIGGDGDSGGDGGAQIGAQIGAECLVALAEDRGRFGGGDPFGPQQQEGRVRRCGVSEGAQDPVRGACALTAFWVRC